MLPLISQDLHDVAKCGSLRHVKVSNLQAILSYISDMKAPIEKRFVTELCKKVFLAGGAEVESNLDHSTPLLSAAWNGHSEVVNVSCCCKENGDQLLVSLTDQVCFRTGA